MSVDVDLQVATDAPDLPTGEQLTRWVEPALEDIANVELTVRLVDREESAALNQRFRSKPGPTNVLSFPADLPAGIDSPYLGDIVICAPLVNEEAAAQGKETEAHWAHLVVHGVLHLRGYDHDDERDAERMESIETRMLADFGYPDPYA